MNGQDGHEPPPLLALHLASPVPPSADSFAGHASKPSRNSLFDQDWGALTPAPARSRSSTVESQFSTSSESTTASSGRRSWMDAPHSPPLQASIPLAPPIPRAFPPPLERSETVTGLDTTPIPGVSNSEAGFDWPTTPSSPAAQPPRPFPSLPPLQPPHPFVSVSSLAPAVPPASPSASSTISPPLSSSRPSFPHRISSTSSNPPDPSAPLPPTAGHSSNPLLDTRRSPSLRLAPTPPYLLGEGRHASVYLASFARGSAPWRLCAAKRLAPDRESQVSGLGEAFILAKLAGSPAAEGGSRWILRLYGVRDERDGVELPLPLSSSHVGSVCVSRRVSGSGGGAKRWSVGSAGARADAGGVPSSPLGRTFPEVVPEGFGALAPGERRRPQSLKLAGAHGDAGGARRKGPRYSDIALPGHGHGHGHSSSHSRLSLLSHALEPPLSSSKRRITLSGAQTLPASPGSPRSPDSPSPSLPGPAPPVPRIDILLEYCPRGHVLQFARCHPDLVDKARWIDWAGQLACAVAWAHEKGVLHADIKPQNVLVAPDLTLRLSDWGTSLFLPPASSPPHRFPTDPHGLGTPSYSPPEFVQRLPSPFGYTADVFPLALTLSTLITAREPYDGLRAVERMLHVASGGWWDWEERRRLREEGGDEAEAEVALSRAGSVRSTRSAASSWRTGGGGGRRRSDSVESVRSVVSNASEAGPGDWGVLRRSLLLEADDDEVSAAAALLLDEPVVPPQLPSPGDEADPAPPRTYPGTATPVQFFLAGTRAADAVPLAARDLLRRMASPAPSARPSAADVVEALRGLAREEGVEAAW